MIRGEPVAGSSQEAPTAVSSARRERVVVRHRRANSRHRKGAGDWSVRRSRRRIISAVVLCTGVLLLMAVGLYLGLSRQDMAPADSRLHGPRLAASHGHG
jgi:hypothetical protein